MSSSRLPLQFVSTLLFILISLISITSGQYHSFGGQGLGILPGAGSYHGSPYHAGLHQSSALHFPQSALYGGGLGGGGSRLGQGYVGNGGIGIKQTDANLADLYGLPRQLAQAPPPQPLQVPQPQMLNPYFNGMGAIPGPYPGQQQLQQYGSQMPPIPYGHAALLNGVGPGVAHYGRGYLG